MGNQNLRQIQEKKRHAYKDTHTHTRASNGNIYKDEEFDAPNGGEKEVWYGELTLRFIFVAKRRDYYRHCGFSLYMVSIYTPPARTDTHTHLRL